MVRKISVVGTEVCKGNLPLCLFLVIDGNFSGLMFSLSLWLKEYSIGFA
jgi:hypothetical protein